MNPEEEKQLEAEISRLLQDLPELSAPGSLVERTLAAIDQRAAAPWHRQPWTAWPAAWRAASLALLLGFFGGLCAVPWEVAHSQWLAEATQRLTERFFWVGAAWSVAESLFQAAVVVVKHMDSRIAIGALIVATCVYLACIGVGSAVARFTLARR